jgi:AcrR family transcriptional regulator
VVYDAWVADAAVFPFPGAMGALPESPDESLWPFLDAATRCIERFGWRRTSVQDVAREAGVERTTVYRRVGSMDDIFRLLIARELHELMATAQTRVPLDASMPEAVVALVAASIEHAKAHPVLAKVLADEPDVVAGFVANGLAELVERATSTLAPLVGIAMAGGMLAQRDPVVVTDWIVRTSLTLLIAPPPVPITQYLTEVFAPVLTP